MTSHWSVRAEYDNINLGRSSVTVPLRSVTTDPVNVQPATGTIVALPGSSVSQSIHTFKLGVNYLFGAGGTPFPDPPAGVEMGGNGRSAAFKASPAVNRAPGWEVEAGTRYWYSSGRFQKDIAPTSVRGPQNPTYNISRLTWEGLKDHSAEAFARVDSPLNVFAKGHIGGGVISGGKINDEDWGLDPPGIDVNTGYSNTEGTASGSISYATLISATTSSAVRPTSSAYSSATA